MKDADVAIGRVLAGLREVEAAPGLEKSMERRVREAAEGGRTRRGWHGLLFGGSADVRAAWVGGVVACGVVIAVAATVELSGHRDGELRAKHGSGASVPPRESEIPERSLHEGDDSQRQHKERQTRNYLIGPGKNVHPAVLWKDDGRLVGESPARTMSMREQFAVSFPAPPMPLTEQERLLLRVVHHSGPDEVALLDQAALSTQDGKETAAFQEFFGKPEKVSQMVQTVSQGESR